MNIFAALSLSSLLPPFPLVCPHAFPPPRIPLLHCAPRPLSCGQDLSSTLSSPPSLLSLIPLIFQTHCNTQIETHTRSQTHSQLQINLHSDQGTTPWRSHALLHYEVTPLFALAHVPIGQSGQEPIFSSGDIDEADLVFLAAPTQKHTQ